MPAKKSPAKKSAPRAMKSTVKKKPTSTKATSRETTKTKKSPTRPSSTKTRARKSIAPKISKVSPRVPEVPKVKHPSASAPRAVITPTQVSASTKTVIAIVTAAAVLFISSAAALLSINYKSSRTKPTVNTAKETVQSSQLADLVSLDEFKDCSITSSSPLADFDIENIDPSTWQAIFSDLQSGDYSSLQTAVSTKLSAYTDKLQELEENPEAKKQLEIQISQCMIGTVRSLDTMVVSMYNSIDKYDRSDTKEYYVSGLSDEDFKRELEIIHQKLVDRSISETNTKLHTDTTVNSYEEMYLELISDLESIDDINVHPNASDYFPYTFSIITSDLFFRATVFDFNWKINAASAHLALPVVDPLLMSSQSLQNQLDNLFNDPDTGHEKKKQENYSANAYNISLERNALDFGLEQLGSYVNYADPENAESIEGENAYRVSGEVGAARYERCESILYNRHIVDSMEDYKIMTYTDITSQAKNLYQIFEARKAKNQEIKDAIESSYFATSLIDIYTTYADPVTGKINPEDWDAFVADTIVIVKQYSSLGNVATDLTFSMLLNPESLKDLALASEILTSITEVVRAITDDETANSVKAQLLEAAKDGQITKEELTDIAKFIQESSASSRTFATQIVEQTKDYRTKVANILDAPYVDSGLGDYNSCRFIDLSSDSAVRIEFTGDRPSYLPSIAKYESKPNTLMRKVVVDIMKAQNILLPFVKTYGADKIDQKEEDIKSMMYISAGVIQNYIESNSLVAKDLDTGSYAVNYNYFKNLMVELYSATETYDTPGIDVLMAIKVDGKTPQALKQEYLDTTNVDEYAEELISKTLILMESYGYEIPQYYSPETY